MLKNLINRVLHKVAYVAPGGKRFRPWLHRRRGAHIGRDVWISQYVYIDEIHPGKKDRGQVSTFNKMDDGMMA